MSRIHGRDTKPELIVRSIVHQMGYRFRLHRTNLPGKPDLVLPGRNKIIFVHGCFWHQHRCRFGRVAPKTNVQFWLDKRNGTVKRDRQNRRALRAAGWDVLTVWECWTREPEQRVIPRLTKFLGQ
ncbi:MAG: DNA mismatch endonuclease Vsr [Fuerstiella sp.]|nr:DNA mismatch endonuclease Vsr [Fuerstiella sp.]